jgi:putative transposase
LRRGSLVSPVEFRLGVFVRYDGRDWAVVGFSPDGVVLRGGPDRSRVLVSLGELLSADDYLVYVDGDQTPGRPLFSGEDIPETALNKARYKRDHVREVLTGYRSGQEALRAPGEPRPEYDARRSLTARIESKREDIGLRSRSTLWNWISAYERHDLLGLVDQRYVRDQDPVARLDARYVAAIRDRLKSFERSSKVSLSTLRIQVARDLTDRYAGEAPQMPPRQTFERHVHRLDYAGVYRPTKSKTRRGNTTRSKHEQSVECNRVGALVEIDSTKTDVYAVDEATGQPRRVHLSAALDVFSRWPRIRLTPGPPTSIDSGLLLRDCVCPVAMRPDWPERCRWHLLGVPAEMACFLDPDEDRPAHAPIVRTENVTTDQAWVYSSELFLGGLARLGSHLTLARRSKASDKPHVERFFLRVRQSLLEHLDGYLGPHPFERGVDGEERAFYFIGELEELIWRWVVTVYADQPHDGIDIDGLPPELCTPNNAWHESVVRNGFIAVPPDPNLFFELLPTKRCHVHHYGIKIGNVPYNGPIVDDFRGDRLRHTMSVDPRNLRAVYFRHPESKEWGILTRTGAADPSLPFTDRTRLLAVTLLRQRGEDPTDAKAVSAMLNVLLDGHARDRAELAPLRRDLITQAAQARAAERDHPINWPKPPATGGQPDRPAGTPGNARPAVPPTVYPTF